jgi:hypothetical protein
MRHDAIEFGRPGLAARAAVDRVTRIATRLAKHKQTAAILPAVDAIDEAFAGYTGMGARVTRVDASVDAGSRPLAAKDEDKSPTSFSTSGDEPLNREIAAHLAAQLDALDRQRARLAKLLCNIDADGLSR